MAYQVSNRSRRKRRPWDKDIITQDSMEAGATRTKTTREKPKHQRPKQSNKSIKKKTGTFGNSYLS